MSVAVELDAQAADLSPPPRYEWHLPPGFPQPLVPADNPMSRVKVELGRRLFHDTRLSSTGRYACASCHRPDRAFTDGLPRAVGATGRVLKRGAMSLTNVAYNAAFTWGDSRVRTLEAQMHQPLFNRHPVEMGLASRAHQTPTGISRDAAYRELFATAFPGQLRPMSMDHVIQAIACFERTLISGRSPFDVYVFDDQSAALPEPAKRGMALFYSARTGCAQCHFGLNFSGPMIFSGHPRDKAIFANTGVSAATDRGLIEVTHRESDLGKFRVPTLRNVALTAPYMHDGSIASLDAVIDHYARGGGHGPNQDPRVRPLTLSRAERDDLIAFLNSLTDPAFTADPRFQ